MTEYQAKAMFRVGETGEPIFRTPCSVGSGEAQDAQLWSAYADGRTDEKEGLRGLLFDAFMNGLAWMQANGDEPPSAWAEAADAYVADVCNADELCASCNGSGEQQFMTHGHGPDDYEVTGLCSECGGTGAAIAAATEGAAS